MPACHPHAGFSFDERRKPTALGLMLWYRDRTVAGSMLVTGELREGE